MRSSFKLFRILGISIEVHITFLLFLLLILAGGLGSLIFFLIIFSIILAHELCHSIVAILSGIPVPRIILLPFGGLASIELPENPMTELKISLSGPLFNFFLSGTSLILIKILNLHLSGYDQLVDAVVKGGVGVFTPAYVLSLLALSNLVLGLFNMLPAFPMDGGRVFRSILALWMDYAKATQIAGRVGQAMFLLLIITGIFTFNIWWVLMGLFLMYASGGEVKLVLLKKTFRGLEMRDVVFKQKKMPKIESSLTVQKFLSSIAKPGQRYYMVSTSNGTLKGILDMQQITPSMAVNSNLTVGSLAKTEYEISEANSKVIDEAKKILSNDVTIIAEGDMVLGYMTPDLFMEMVQFYTLKKKTA